MNYSLICLLLMVVTIGCGGGVQEKVYELKGQSSLRQARSTLQRYASGQPLGSEAEGFDRLVENVRETNPAEADVLQKAFAEITAKPASRASIAKKALEKLPEPAEIPAE